MAAAIEAVRLLPPLAWEGSKKIGAATGKAMKAKVWKGKKAPSVVDLQK